MDVRKFNEAMDNFLGECGAEAVIDAINFYLLYNKDFACEEDKLILASILFDSDYSSLIYPKFNALHNMSISFGGDING